jgi:Acyl-CoA dehydrogenase, C-terminal domain
MGFPLGVARRALDDFAELARTKTRGMTERQRLADDPHVQAQLAAAESGLQSARVFAFDVIGQLWDTACAGDSLSLDQRAQLSLATQHAVQRRSWRWTGCSAWPERVRYTPTSRFNAASGTCAHSTRTPTSARRSGPGTPSTCLEYHSRPSCCNSYSATTTSTNWAAKHWRRPRLSDDKPGETVSRC